MSWLLHRTELTPEQLRIVEMSPESHRLILGPPGSGKTQVLIHRAAYLARNYNSKPERFKVLVFTNVIKEYIRSGIKFLDIPEDSVCTFDRLCLDMYQSHISRSIPKKNGKPDFVKIQSSVLSLVKMSPKIQRSQDFILVDEGQDLVPEAHEMICLMANHVSVFADPQQKIFEDGASEDKILSSLRIPNKSISLLGAYRNSPYVSQLAACFISDPAARQKYLSQMHTVQKVKERPLLFKALSYEEETDRLVEIIRARMMMNERIGIFVPTNRYVHGLAKGLQYMGIAVEKAVKRGEYDFNNASPKIATYHQAKGLTFDTVILPRLVNSAFGRLNQAVRQRILFVGIARATQWVYMSTVLGQGISELDVLSKAGNRNAIEIQTGLGSGHTQERIWDDADSDDDYSIL